MSISKRFIEWFGWYGTFAIVSAYFLNSFGFLSTGNIWYQILNITGSLGIVIVSSHKRAYQPMTLNMIWLGIGLLSLLK